MVWGLLVVVWLGTAVITAVVAERRDRDRTVWFVLGLVFPLAALAALLLGYPKHAARKGRLAEDVESALRESRVAATLAAQGPLTPDGIAEVCGLSDEAVSTELGALKILGLVRRAGGGSWGLAPRAAEALETDDDVTSPTDGGDGT